MPRGPITSKLTEILSNQRTMLCSLGNLCEDDPVNNKMKDKVSVENGMVVITCERNGVYMTLNECINSIESDIETVFSDVNRLGIIIGDIQKKLGMKVIYGGRH